MAIFLESGPTVSEGHRDIADDDTLEGLCLITKSGHSPQFVALHPLINSYYS